MKSSRRWASGIAAAAAAAAVLAGWLALSRSPDSRPPARAEISSPAPTATPEPTPAPPTPDPPAPSPASTPAPPRAVTPAREPAAPGPSAEEIMRDVERSFRSEPRAVRMDVATTRVQTERVGGMPPYEELRLWGLLNGDPETTEALYVFFLPRRYRGTGLLIKDRQGSRDDDSLWYHMRTFRRFQNIPQTSLRLLVAGTCMTYEDARGFLATDRYEFRAAGQDVILARPLTPELESDTGYRSVEIHVDTAKSFVREIRFEGLNGQPLKLYTAADPVRVGSSWLPGRARIEDLQSAVVSEVKYQYWPLATLPPAALFDTDVEDSSLLERLAGALAGYGIEAAPATLEP